jgi:hypothetical protein
MTHTYDMNQALRNHQGLCLNLTGTNALHELKDWCQERSIYQCEDFELLHRNILNCIHGFPYSKPNRLNLAIGCIDEEIVNQSIASETICDMLELEIFDLSIEYGDVVIPGGQDAYQVYYKNRLILNVRAWNTGWYCPKSNGVVYNDPYSAIVGAYEFYNPQAVMSARKEIEAAEIIAEIIFDYD